VPVGTRSSTAELALNRFTKYKLPDRSVVMPVGVEMAGVVAVATDET